MMDKNKLLNYISDFFLSLAASFSFIYALITSLNFKNSPLFVVLWLALCIGIYSLIFINRRSLAISGASAILVLAALMAYLGRKHLYGAIFESISKFAVWIVDYIRGDAPLEATYASYVVVLLCLSISLPLYFFTHKCFNFYVPLVGGCGLFVSQWMLEFFVSYRALYIFLFCIILYYFKHIFHRKLQKETNEYTSPGVFTVWAAPLAIVILLVSLAMPTSDKPLEWKWLDEKITKVFEYFNTNYNYTLFEYFSISTAGFGENNGKLGGKATLDKTHVLSVISPRTTYLKGSVSDIYDGARWTSSSVEKNPVTDFSDRQNVDLFETQLGLQLLSRSDAALEDFFLKDELEVTIENLRTKSLFIPAKIASIDPMDGRARQIFVDPNGALSSDKALGKSYKYTLSAYSINYGDENLKTLLRKSKKGFYEEFSAELRNSLQRRQTPVDRFLLLSRNRANDVLRLQRYATAVYAKYLQLPSSLPRKVKDLAAEVSSKGKNNYDKVKAIEQHLSSSYPYTLNTKNTPKGRDFVDYFLFDLKQGYCTYYASAMTVMVRSLGIPARYVEGYVLPSSPESGNTYVVTNQQAHAWVEVYFEGFGWLPFEPTSPFVSAFYSDRNATGVYTQEFLEDPSMQDYLDELQGYGEIDPLIHDPEALDTSAGQLPPKEVILAIALGIVVLVLLTVIFVNLIRSRLLLFKAVKMQPRKCILSLYRHYVQLLSAQRLAIKPGETALQYSGRIDDYFLFSTPTFRNITDIFVRARYSAEEISEEDKKYVFRFNRILKDKSRSNMGKFLFFANRYLMGKF